MQNDVNIIEIAPKNQDIDEILIWLKSERDSNVAGFYHNRNVIYESFESGNAIVFKHEEKNIGMVIWHEDEIRVDIDIFVIHPYYQGQGYGRLFYKAISEYFSTKGFKAVKLFCEPRSSERFWRKMGLSKFPDCGLTEHELTYYGILVDTASKTYIKNADKIELWDVEPYEAEGKEPKWTWYIETQNEVLLYPIIQPCNCNWNLRWSRNGQVITEEKVKYFTDEDYEVYCSRFLYIDKLEEL
ncbi:MAG: GNAT family N-acetyltransferase [Lachnospiraceae bacterium]